jgi:hypothetical protein
MELWQWQAFITTMIWWGFCVWSLYAEPLFESDVT